VLPLSTHPFLSPGSSGPTTSVAGECSGAFTETPTATTDASPPIGAPSGIFAADGTNLLARSHTNTRHFGGAGGAVAAVAGVVEPTGRGIGAAVAAGTAESS
jgi:hypothetical protein